MEPDVIANISWSDDLPTQEGLYLFRSKHKNINSQEKYYISNFVDLVHVKKRTVSSNKYIYSYLECDSDSWETWYNLKKIPFEGVWSNRINFE
jgi:hypothetical protein